MNDSRKQNKQMQGFTELDTQQVVDQLLLDSLLKGHYQDNAESIKHRIDKACTVLKQPTRFLAIRWVAGLTTAAAAIVIIGLMLVLSSPQSVQADLTSILAAFDLGDKTYQIDISNTGHDDLPAMRGPGRRRYGHHRPPFKQPRRSMSARRFDGATLYTRGRDFVLVYRGPRGSNVIKGRNDRDSWLISPWGGAKMVDPNRLHADIPEHIKSLLFLNLRETLHQIKKNYHITGPTLGSEEDGYAQIEYYIADRTRPHRKLPKHIELWFDVETNHLQQIRCTGITFNSPMSQRYTIEITLTSTEPLPIDWFTEAVHRNQH